MATMKLNGENNFNIFNVYFLVSPSKLLKAYMCRYDLLMIRSFQYFAIALTFHKRNHLSSFIRNCSNALKSRLIRQSSFWWKTRLRKFILMYLCRPMYKALFRRTPCCASLFFGLPGQLCFTFVQAQCATR